MGSWAKVFTFRTFEDELATVIVHAWPKVVFVEVDFEHV